jgi:hypothetical protein
MKQEDYIFIKELSSCTIYKRSDGILILRQPEGRDSVTIPEIEEQMEVFLDIQKGELSPLLVVVNKIKKLENEEKMLLMSSITKIANRVAMVTTNPMAIFIFNILIFLYRPPMPSKVFSKEQEASEWLKGN